MVNTGVDWFASCVCDVNISSSRSLRKVHLDPSAIHAEMLRCWDEAGRPPAAPWLPQASPDRAETYHLNEARVLTRGRDVGSRTPTFRGAGREGGLRGSERAKMRKRGGPPASATWSSVSWIAAPNITGPDLMFVDVAPLSQEPPGMSILKLLGRQKVGYPQLAGAVFGLLCVKGREMLDLIDRWWSLIDVGFV